MNLDVQVKALEKQKVVLKEELKVLQIKQAQILKIKQLTDDIAKLKSSIHKIKQDEIKLKD